MTPEYFESIDNWSPIVDLMIDSPWRASPAHDEGRHEIFTTSGRAPYGAISHLRHGFNARLRLTFEHEDLDSVTTLFVLPDGDGNGVFFVLCNPVHTNLIYITDDGSDVRPNYDETNCGVDLEKETITIGLIGTNKVVQVTRSAIIIMNQEYEDIAMPRQLTKALPPDVVMSAAAMDRDSGLLVAAISKDNGNYVQLEQILADDTPTKIVSKGEAQILSSEATCVVMHRLHGSLYVFVGTTAGTLQLFHVNDEGLVPVLEHPIAIKEREVSATALSAGLAVVCESIAIIRIPPESASAAPEYALLCGLRNGCLYAVQVEFDPNESTEGQHHGNIAAKATS